MIATLRGRVLSVSATGAVVEVGGVGLQLALTPGHAAGLKLDHEENFYTVMIVREDEISLYGFEDEESKQIFELLRGVTGVGPRSALAVLGALGAGGVANAIVNEDDAELRKVSGIGPKTAKLITVSLAGKIRADLTSEKQKPKPNTVQIDVIRALVGLGWTERIAEQTVREVADSDADNADTVDGLLRLALSRLGPRGTGAIR